MLTITKRNIYQTVYFMALGLIISNYNPEGCRESTNLIRALKDAGVCLYKYVRPLWMAAGLGWDEPFMPGQVKLLTCPDDLHLQLSFETLEQLMADARLDEADKKQRQFRSLIQDDDRLISYKYYELAYDMALDRSYSPAGCLPYEILDSEALINGEWQELTVESQWFREDGDCHLILHLYDQDDNLIATAWRGEC
jgi:hypothetical protein